MKQETWNNFRKLIDGFRSGELTRAEFCYFWAIAQEYRRNDV